jgi:hypothetical protein
MENFSYKELQLIRRAIDKEIMCREKNPIANPEITMEFEALYNKVDNLIRNIRRNN